MTCIVGYADGKDVWIGGDSAGVAGLDLTIRSDSKVFTRTGKVLNDDVLTTYEMIFGFTSSFRMGQIIRYDMELPNTLPPKDSEECEAWMVREFIPKLRKALKDGGYSSISNNEENGGTFLVGVNGTLFSIQGDFQVGRNQVQFGSVGCGANFALGAMTVLDWEHPGLTLLSALEAATRWSAGVSGPYTIITTEPEPIPSEED